MPLFEYRCSRCGRVDERLVRVPAPDSTACGDCGAEAHRLVALTASYSSGDCGPSSSGGT